MVLVDNSPSFASNIVAEAVDKGINHIDVAPTYGNAQERLGPALEPYRKRVFVACKEEDWTKDGCAKLLEQSLRLLHTDYVDLYQLHGLTKMSGSRADLRSQRRHGDLRGGPASQKSNHPHPNCWYEPTEQAPLSLRWTLSQPITAALPPGDESYFRLGMEIGQNFQSITEPEKNL